MFARKLPPSSVQGNDALHRLLEIYRWGVNGDTVNGWDNLILIMGPGDGYFHWFPLKTANLDEQTHRKPGARSPSNKTCLAELI